MEWTGIFPEFDHKCWNAGRLSATNPTTLPNRPCVAVGIFATAQPTESSFSDCGAMWRKWLVRVGVRRFGSLSALPSQLPEAACGKMAWKAFPSDEWNDAE